MQLSRTQSCLCWLAYIVVWLLHRSYRYTRINEELRIKARAMAPQDQTIYACWHQNTLTTVMAHFYERVVVLVSRSFDGEMIASIIKKFGVGSARGSSSRGGREALRELIDSSQQGYDVGITVDGPKGPAFKVKAGVIAMAARSGVPILPTLVRGRRFWTFTKSWDHFRLAKPFTEILILYGEPIKVSSELNDAELKEIAETLAKKLGELEQKMDFLISQAHKKKL